MDHWPINGRCSCPPAPCPRSRFPCLSRSASTQWSSAPAWHPQPRVCPLPSPGHPPEHPPVGLTAISDPSWTPRSSPSSHWPLCRSCSGPGWRRGRGPDRERGRMVVSPSPALESRPHPLHQIVSRVTSHPHSTTQHSHSAPTLHNHYLSSLSQTTHCHDQGIHPSPSPNHLPIDLIHTPIEVSSMPPHHYSPFPSLPHSLVHSFPNHPQTSFTVSSLNPFCPQHTPIESTALPALLQCFLHPSPISPSLYTLPPTPPFPILLPSCPDPTTPNISIH